MSVTKTRAYTPSMQFLDENGKPLVFGFLCTYKAETNTPLATYNDNGQLNPVKIPLNELGSPENGVQLDVAKEYKFVLLRSDGTTLWIKDHVKAAGVGDVIVEGLNDIVADTTNVHVTKSLDGKTAYIAVSSSVAIITTQTTFEQVTQIIGSGRTPILRYTQGDNVYDFHLSADYDDIQYEFRCISGDNDYVKTIELSENGWSEVSTRRLATHEALQSESRTREAADTALGERIESINDENPDWDELDRTSHAFIDNKPVRISDEEINALED